jgi:diguanylate cyclase (GGDEF)-like protein
VPAREGTSARDDLQGAPTPAGRRRALSGLTRFAGRRGGSAAFGLRLALALLAALLLVGLVGYAYMDQEMRAAATARFAADQAADASSFESIGARTRTSAEATARIDAVLDVIARREGVLETLLIGPDRIVRASGDDSAVGTRDTDARIEAALGRGETYAGREADAARDSRDFEFVVPVDLPGGRHAFEVSYDHSVIDSDLSNLRRGLLLVGLLALFGGGAVFYLFGGRALLVSHRRALQRATRDGLTDLPNQRAFQDELSQAVAAASRNDDPLALIALDVDDFKFINDRHGHPHGDAILRQVADVLREGRPGDRAFRIGGDEFAVLLPHTDAEGGGVLARRLMRGLSEARLAVTMGVGASRPGQTADLLHAEADAALYEAKRLGGNQIAHFDDLHGEVVVIGADKRAAVRRLIDEARLTTVYQPIWGLTDGELLGVEALTRPSPDYGLSGPAEAFDIAEQIGRVHELDVLCITRALAGAKALPDGALLFLNICPRTLDLDADRNDWLRLAVERSGFPVERVVIEITERFGGRARSILRCLEHLRAQGFQIAADDVGSGNSGLAMLRQVKVEFVKLDRAVVAAAATDRGARAVLMAIAAYARQTGAFVIAEGIEDDETLAFLRSIDERELVGDAVIQGGQGYGLGRPLPVMPDVSSPCLRAAA